MKYLSPLVNEDDFYSVDEREIHLSAAEITEAARISDRVVDRDLQWQVYLSLLALYGFKTWLGDRDEELELDTSQCQLLSESPTTPAANYLQIGGFKICVIAKGCSETDYVAIPAQILTHPAEAAHFYIIVEVLEELSEASMWGFLRYDQLTQYLTREPLEEVFDETYFLPLNWLNLEFDELISYLRCFNPVGIPLPAVATVHQSVATLEKLFTGCWQKIFSGKQKCRDLAIWLGKKIDLPRSSRSTLYWQGCICSYIIALLQLH